jgi:hypothetical protein
MISPLSSLLPPSPLLLLSFFSLCCSLPLLWPTSILFLLLHQFLTYSPTPLLVPTRLHLTLLTTQPLSPHCHTQRLTKSRKLPTLLAATKLTMTGTMAVAGAGATVVEITMSEVVAVGELVAATAGARAGPPLPPTARHWSLRRWRQSTTRCQSPVSHSQRRGRWCSQSQSVPVTHCQSQPVTAIMMDNK